MNLKIIDYAIQNYFRLLIIDTLVIIIIYYFNSLIVFVFNFIIYRY